MSLQHIRDLLRANGLEVWARFALFAVLKFMLPPGLSPEVALTWGRHVLDIAPQLTHMLRARPAAPTLTSQASVAPAFA